MENKIEHPLFETTSEGDIKQVPEPMETGAVLIEEQNKITDAKSEEEIEPTKDEPEFRLFIKHDPESLMGIYAVSKRVKPFSEAVNKAMRLVKWFNENMSIPTAKQVDAWSLSDCQVTLNPNQVFVVHKELVKEYNWFFGKETQQKNKGNYYFPKQAIFNAEILEAPEKILASVPKRVIGKDAQGNVKQDIIREETMTPNEMFVPESCSSFPLKKEKNMKRFYRIKVRYQIKSWYGFKTITEWVYGLKGHIFQHEIQHAKGNNIYYGRIIHFKAEMFRNFEEPKTNKFWFKKRAKKVIEEKIHNV
jgi:hypothetical protein